MRIFDQRSTAISLLFGMLAALVVACQAEGTPASGDPGGARTQPTREAGLPTSTSGHTPTALPEPSPTEITASTVLPQTAFTLTILYTGEVHGEILPCPG
jgi:hypothetical protein